MHAAIVHFAPVLGAEKSKTPFYVAGGVLVAWALFVSLGRGLRVRDFPSDAGAQRVVMAVTVLLVLAAASTAVLTSGGSSAGGATAASQASTTNSPQTGASAGAPGKLAQTADPSGQLRFVKSRLEAKAGTVSINFLNSSPLPHNLTIARGSAVLGATPTFNGGSRTLTLHLAPGTYKFYCSVPGHREAGMEGTLVVS